MKNEAKKFIEKEGLEYSLPDYDEGGFSGIDEIILEEALTNFGEKMITKFFTWINDLEELKYTPKGITFYVNEFLKQLEK